VALATAFVAGCHGGGGGDDIVGGATAPGGLHYSVSHVFYTLNQPIVNDVPSSDGGPITHYSIEPALPAGLTINPDTGVISGTPTQESPLSPYTVTATGPGGSEQIVLEIGVSSPTYAPVNLNYNHPVAEYVVGTAITPNSPDPDGGAVSAYSVSPALPAGLSLDPVTGVISGAPGVAQASAVYTVTGSNSAGAATQQLTITVDAQSQPVNTPVTGVAYRSNWAVLAVGRALTQMPTVEGGAVDHFEVDTPLPAGFVLDQKTGEISGAAQSASAETSYTVTAVGVDGSHASTTISVQVVPSNTWLTLPPMSSPHAHHTATMLLNGDVLVAGGLEGDSLGDLGTDNTNTAQLFNVRTGQWEAVPGMNQARQMQTANLLPSGQVLVAGGIDASGASTKTAEIYDPVSNTWTQAASMLGAHSQHTATSLADGNVLVAGGNLATLGSPSPSAVVEQYNPTSARWVSTQTLGSSRRWHSAFRVGDRVVVTGGYMANGAALNSTELFAAGSWKNGGVLPSAVGQAMGMVTSGGGVLLAGGYTGAGVISDVRSYDLNSAKWTLLQGTLALARAEAGSAVLNDGSLLLVGGKDNVTGTTGQVEKVDPATGIGTALPPLPSRVRETNPVATVLPDGNVLVTGGIAVPPLGGFSAATTQVFLYVP
jgi:hypothetical protein